MSSLSFDRAIEVVHDATCIRVDSDEVLYPDVSFEDETITLSLNDGNYVAQITRADNKTVMVVNNGTELRFYDDNGNMWDILPLGPMSIRGRSRK